LPAWRNVCSVNVEVFYSLPKKVRLFDCTYLKSSHSLTNTQQTLYIANKQHIFQTRT